MTLQKFTIPEWDAAIDAARAVAIPGDMPDWLADLAPCPACHNSGEACGMCGGGGYGDDQQPPDQPNQDNGGVPNWPTLVSREASCPDCGWNGNSELFVNPETGAIDCPQCCGDDVAQLPTIASVEALKCQPQP